MQKTEEKYKNRSADYADDDVRIISKLQFHVDKLISIHFLQYSGGVNMAYSAYNSWLNYHKDETFPGFTPLRLFWVSATLNWCYNRNILDLFVFKDQFQPEINSAFGCKQ